MGCEKSSFVTLVETAVRVGKELRVPAEMTTEAGKILHRVPVEISVEFGKEICRGPGMNGSGSL